MDDSFIYSSPPFFLPFLPAGKPSFWVCTFSLVHDSSESHSNPFRYGSSISSSAWQDSVSELWFQVSCGSSTFFLNCLWIASNASLIVTPFRFRAVTSSPRGKCRSIFLTGGVVSIFFRIVGSSTVLVDVLSFLWAG